MPDSDSYEHTDEENLTPTRDAKKKGHPGRKPKIIKKEEDEHFKYFEKVEEYERWLTKSEKEREQEIFNRIEEYEDKQNKERIRMQLEKKESIKQGRTKGGLLPDSDVYSCGEDDEPPSKVPRRFQDKNAQRVKELFGEDSDSGSSDSSSSDDDNDFVPPAGSAPPKSKVCLDTSTRKSDFNVSIVVPQLIEHKEDLMPARLTRRDLAQIVHAPFFGEVVKGAFVMIRVGINRELPSECIICEIVGVLQTPKQYPLEDTVTNKTLQIRFGSYECNYRLKFVSNGEWSSQQFEEYRMKAEDAHVLPAKEDIAQKGRQIKEALNHRFTEKEFSEMINEKRRFIKVPENRIAKKTKLLSKLKYAEENGLHIEVQEIRAEIGKLDGEETEPRQRENNSDILKGILMGHPIRSRGDGWTPPKKSLDRTKEQLGENPFTRKRARPKVITGARSRSDLTEITPKSSNKLVSRETKVKVEFVSNETMVKVEKAENSDVDDFELYNSLKFNIDISLPYEQE